MAEVYITVPNNTKTVWVRLAQQESMNLSDWVAKHVDSAIREQVIKGALKPLAWMQGLPERHQQALLRAGVMSFELFEEHYLAGGEAYLISLPNIGKKAAQTYVDWYESLEQEAL